MTFASAKFRALLPTAALLLFASYGSIVSGAVLCGNLLGESALAAANLMQGVFELVTFLELLFATGTSVIFTKELGAFHLRRARGYFTLGLFAAGAVGLLASLVALFARNPVLAAFSAAPEVTYYARSFWLGYLPTIAVAPFSAVLYMMCYVDGGTRLTAFACATRLVMTWLFAYPLTRLYGAAGCALGQFGGQLAMLAVLLLHFRNPRRMLGFSGHFRFSDLRAIVFSSLGDASKNICKSALLFAMNAYVLAKFGPTRLPILAVIVTVIGFTDVVDCLGNALQPLVSVYVAERNTLLTRRVMWVASKLAFVLGLAGTLLLACFPDLALAVCGVEDSSMIAEARTAVRFVSVIVLGFSFVLLLNSYYILINREGLSSAIAIMAGFGLPVFLVPIFSGFIGFSGVCLALGISPYVAIFLLFAYLACTEGVRRLPLLLPCDRDSHLRVYDLELSPKLICETAEAVQKFLKGAGFDPALVIKATLLVEETLMTVFERNGTKRVLAEVTVDLNDDALTLILRDDGEIFDITDADAQVSSLRSYLVSNLMTAIPNRRNLTTTGFNRNVYRL